MCKAGNGFNLVDADGFAFGDWYPTKEAASRAIAVFETHEIYGLWIIPCECETAPEPITDAREDYFEYMQEAEKHQ